MELYTYITRDNGDKLRVEAEYDYKYEWDGYHNFPVGELHYIFYVRKANSVGDYYPAKDVTLTREEKQLAADNLWRKMKYEPDGE